MKFIRKENLLILGLLVLGACAQSRRSHLAGKATDELWAPVVLNQNEAGAASQFGMFNNGLGNYGAMGSFELQLNISRNSAYIYVSSLGFNANEVPFRILARRTGGAGFDLLKDNVMVGQGGEVEVFAANGANIEAYETWRIEMVINYDVNNFEVMATPGNGLVVVQQTVDFEELYSDAYANTSSLTRNRNR